MVSLVWKPIRHDDLWSYTSTVHSIVDDGSLVYLILLLYALDWARVRFVWSFDTVRQYALYLRELTVQIRLNTARKDVGSLHSCTTRVCSTIREDELTYGWGWYATGVSGWWICTGRLRRKYLVGRSEGWLVKTGLDNDEWMHSRYSTNLMLDYDRDWALRWTGWQNVRSWMEDRLTAGTGLVN